MIATTEALAIPELPEDADTLTAALAYADAGWYVLPVKRGTKDPGSEIGKGWQHKSSRDPKVITAWFAGTGHDIALHCGRSGAVVFDVDDPDKLPDVLRKHLAAAPFQSTRPDAPGRGHYIFMQPPGRTIGNSGGRLGGAWGQVRGLNGVIIAEPSHHAEGGEYRWVRPMSITALPDELANMLDNASPAEDAASDAMVAAFIDEHQQATRPDVLHGLRKSLLNNIEAGNSVHNSTVSALTGAMKEARAGYYTAQHAIDTLKPIFVNAVALGGSTGKVRTGAVAENEWNDIVAWAVGQALAAELGEVRARTNGKMPNGVEWVQTLTEPACTGQAEPPPHPDDPGPIEPAHAGEPRDYESSIQQRMASLRIDREARRRLDDEDRPPIILPSVKSLETLLAEPDTPARYRIDQVAPADARVILSAQYKAGKTTLIGNLIRSLVDEEPFLGRFTIHAPAQRLVLIDDEMSEDTLRCWLRDQKITNTAAVADVITLRGKLSIFNLLDDKVRGQWATRLSDLGCDYLALDCLRPILDALGLEENRDVGKFLVPFDALLTQAGISDALLVQHMGHANERARGDSRLQDWPDATWRVVRETEEPHSPRFFSAYGRDVSVPEGRLSFDPTSRRLAYAPGSRRDAEAEAAQIDVIKLLAERAGHGDPLSKNGIETELFGEHTQKAIRSAVNLAVENGFLIVTEGPRRAKLHAIAYPCVRCGMPVASKGERHQTCPSGPEGLFE